MEILLKCFLLILAAHSSFAVVTINATYTNPETNLVLYTIKHTISLTCETNQNVTMMWRKNGTTLAENSRIDIDDKKTETGYVYTLKIKHSTDEDAGNYSCTAYQDNLELASSKIIVNAKVAVRIKGGNTNVVEEETLRLQCETIGHPKVSWLIESEKYSNQSLDKSFDRVNITDFVDEEKNTFPNTVLIIKNVVKEDRGRYTCFADNPYLASDTANATSMVRIKDKYAALWPFLGICAEVVVLCAIIIIYEKKRNKTELEESDTDQSPDQKNTPDHGKEANLRHRQ